MKPSLLLAISIPFIASAEIQSTDTTSDALKDLGLSKTTITADAPNHALIGHTFQIKNGIKKYTRFIFVSKNKVRFDIITGNPLWDESKFIIKTPLGIIKNANGIAHGTTLKNGEIKFELNATFSDPTEKYTIIAKEIPIAEAKKKFGLMPDLNNCAQAFLSYETTDPEG